jgi:large subunit ribosomal protein L18
MSTLNKKVARLRRAKRARMKIQELHLRDADLVRLSVTRSAKHISAQLIKMEPLAGTSVVLGTASTQQADIKSQCKYTGNSDAAAKVGKAIANLAKQLNVSKIAFDRAGFKYHGRVKALADAAREGGLDF